MRASKQNGTARAWLGAMLAVLIAGLAALPVHAEDIAPRPPMGWNSWDAYGLTIDEAQFKDNVRVLAGWKDLGWTYAVIDEGWYMADPFAKDLATRKYRIDAHGRLLPVVARFPSAADGHGLRALGDWVHAQGLKFGIHVIRGIPKAAVEANMPIAGSRFHAAEAADRQATCPWDDGNYGIADNAAGQAYYDSLMRQYAGWGVDFVKVDCIADHPYRPSEIRQIGKAIARSGRPMVLSLSPGPARLKNFDRMNRWSQMWRIADDLWDGWTFDDADWPNGVKSAFANLAKWNGHVGPDSWPDADMLPFGSLRPHPGWGDPRQSRLGDAEMRTAFTLFAIARSPLILGGNLTELDDATRGIVMNHAVIALDQQDRVSHPLSALPASLGGARLWISAPKGQPVDTVAIFNADDAPLHIDAAWSLLGVNAAQLAACDLWKNRPLSASSRVTATVAPHDVLLLGIGDCR
ncbi:glycoside hydrolase family 27 protein [Stakelama marina]|uniref:Alpha-galactosidase n=1 Tax=Stakelama marina TaxID=2826939 RepID=A0A8T4IC16_9SPHN|nr:glycoside hydrolase family 27 protein [Stakelama marina]MBR0552568.1 glycoside hydrolase family 27 protein [Stakelama marina]